MTKTLPTDQDTLSKEETYSLIGADKVKGTDVYNLNGDDIGEIDEIMIDKVSGKVAYAVMTFGGFLGIGEERRAIPWSVLRYDTSLNGYVANASDEKLRTIPPVTQQSYQDRTWGNQIHTHFGVSPFWTPRP